MLWYRIRLERLSDHVNTIKARMLVD
jgi:hypothetical protein